MLQWLLTFLGFLLLITILHPRDNSSILQALIFTIYFFIVEMFAARFGFGVSIVGFIVGYFVILQLMKYDLGDAFLFLLACQAIQVTVAWGVLKYFV